MQSPEVLVQAVQSGNLSKVKQIIQQRPDLSGSITGMGIPITMLAAYYRQPQVFEWLMAQRSNPSIYEATAAGLVDRVADILEARPDLLDAYARDGFMPLGLACYFNQLPVAKLLVEKGADVNRVASNGSNVAPIHAAIAANSEPLTRLLLENGADANLPQSGGVTALHSAAHRGNADIVKLLLEHGADPKLKTDDGRTALVFAQEDKHAVVAKILEDI